MKTTVDIPRKDMEEVMKHTKAKTKTAAVALAVAEYNRRQRLSQLSEKMGTFRELMTRGDLRKIRGMS